MKKVYNIICGKSGHIAAILCVLVAGFLWSDFAVAADGEFRKSWITVYSSSKGSDETFMLNNGASSGACNDAASYTVYDNNHKWGVLTGSRGLFVKYIMGQGWSKDGINQIGNDSFSYKYRTYRVGSTPGAWSEYNMTYFKCVHETNKTKSYSAQNGDFDGCDIKIADNTTIPGDYQFEFTITMKRNWTGGSETRCLPNNEVWNGYQSGYNSTFTISGFSDEMEATLNFGDTNQGAAPTKTSSFTHYGNLPSLSDLTIDDYSGSVDPSTEVKDKTAFELAGISNSGLSVTFKTSGKTIDKTYYAQVTITDSNAPSGYQSKTIVLKGKVITPQPTVRLAESPIVSNGPHTTMSGYVRYTGCYTTDAVSKVGFVYSTSEIDPDSYTTSLPTNHIDLSADEVAALNGRTNSAIASGDKFSKTAYGLEENTDYYYRAYIYRATAVAGRKYFFSEQGTFHTGTTCDFSSIGDTVYYTIDASKEADWCSLRFPSLQDAVEDMETDDRGHDPWKDADNMLTKPVVFEVVAGTYGNSDNSQRVTSLESINTTSVSTTITNTFKPSPESAEYRLIVRAKDPSKMPVFEGGLSLLKARSVTLKNLKITRNNNTSTHEGAAVELGVYASTDVNYSADDLANLCPPGAFMNADIQLIGCKIDATSFNCIHAAGCQGLLFDQCEFKMTKPTYGTDAENNNCRDWGASVKLMSCKDVQFTRNSLKGSHASTLFMQYVQDMLIMNNVFWNDNTYTQNVAFVRPVVLASYTNGQSKSVAPPGKNTNIAVYYNTFYLADHDSDPSHTDGYPVDFLRFGCYSTVYGDNTTAQRAYQSSYYDVDNMYFKYNNCYSYDDYISSRHLDDTSNGCAFQGITLPSDNFTPNNFWSEGDGANKDKEDVAGGLAFPSGATVNTTGGNGSVQHINVKHIVCQSTADNPDDLVVSGSSLNVGYVPPTSAVEVLNEASLTLADRFEEIARPEGGTGWTYGAFQQTLAPDPLSVIIWAGSESDRWDIRGNWRTEDGKRLNCVYGFTENLKVIIPDGTDFSPLIPAWGVHTINPSTEEATDPTIKAKRGLYPKEYVEANRTVSSAAVSEDITKFAAEIDLKHGATIKGVENLLGDGTLRYTEGHNTLMVPRSKWVLVSSVIKPWDSDGPQNVRGLDFFMDGVPQVYLRDISVSGDAATWNKSYESLWTELPADKGFAIRIPDQYGPTRLTAEEYYNKHSDAEKKIMANDSIKYDFYGRFYNEAALPSYSVTASTKKVVSNTYPANIDATELKKHLKDNDYGSLLVYDRENVSFRTSQAGDIIRSQQAYIIIPASDGTLTIPTSVFIDGSAKENYLKSTEVEKPYVSIDAVNLYASAGSNILVTLDELKDNSYNLLYDDEKLFNNMEIDLPEVYIMEYDKKLCSVTLPTLEREIPLGLRVLKKMYVRFKLRSKNGMDQAILIDREKEMERDLIDGETYYTVELNPGIYEGRFYLNLGASGSDVEPVITEAAEQDADSGISIYSGDREITVSSSSNVNLESLHITNMAGVTRILPLKDAHYNRITINDGTGVYVVKAVGDMASKTEKVIVK